MLFVVEYFVEDSHEWSKELQIYKFTFFVKIFDNNHSIDIITQYPIHLSTVDSMNDGVDQIWNGKFSSSDKQVFTDVPVLKFIGNEAIVVFFEGRPEVATLVGRFQRYEVPYKDDDLAGFKTYDMFHINAYPGFTATITKEKVTISNGQDSCSRWVLSAEDIKYSRL